MDDVRAVMDAVGSKRAAVMGFSEGSPMSALFAATYPERVEKLLLFGGFALSTMAADFEAKATERLKSWGTGEILKQAWPSLIAKAERHRGDGEDRTAFRQPRRDQGADAV